MKSYKSLLVLVFLLAFLYFKFAYIAPFKRVNAYPVAQAPVPAERRVTPEDLARLKNEIRRLEREIRDVKSQVRSLEAKVRQLDLNRT